MKQTCPNCGGAVKTIRSTNGAEIVVDWTRIVAWTPEGDKRRGEYRHTYVFQGHNLTCAKKKKWKEVK